MEKIPLKIHHKGQLQEILIRKGLGLQAIEKNCPWLEFDCRGADCGICIIQVQEGAENLSAPTAAEVDFLKAMHGRPHERLACQCRVFGPLTIEIDDYI